MNELIRKAELVMDEVRKVVIGKDETIQKVLTAILAKGHILIEDIPGVGKTTLAMAFSKAMELTCHRMQFTPDVLPSDVVGFYMYQKNKEEAVFHPGSIQCNIFLADEINRTSSKTQSALLEVMEEGRVTVDGVTMQIPDPFLVIATQNPIGSVGTQLLPESQLDRFMVKLSMGYPDMGSEIKMLKERHTANPIEQVNCVITREELLQMQVCAEAVFMHDEVYQYVARLVMQTRESEFISLGVSPRGSLALCGMAKARAFLMERNYVLPEDVRHAFPEVCGHRMLLHAKARVNQVTMEEIIGDILKQVSEPKISI